MRQLVNAIKWHHASCKCRITLKNVCEWTLKKTISLIYHRFLRNYRNSDLFGIFRFESGNAIKTTDVQYGNICPIILKLLIVWDFCKFLTKVHKTQLFILDKTRTMSLYFVQIKINYGKRYQNSFKCWITRRDILTKTLDTDVFLSNFYYSWYWFHIDKWLFLHNTRLFNKSVALIIEKIWLFDQHSWENSFNWENYQKERNKSVCDSFL